MELLQQVRIIDPSQGIDRIADVLIIEGKIKAIAERIVDYPASATILKGENLILGTGLVDLYSHSSEPGNEGRESLKDLVNAAAAGGFTQVGILSDTIPRIDNSEVLTALVNKTKHLSSPNLVLPQIGFWGWATEATIPRQMSELGAMKSEVIGFYDSYDLASLNLFKQVLEYLHPWQSTIAIALHTNELANAGVVREGLDSIRYGMVGYPGFAEAAIIAAVIEMVAAIPTPVHIMRVSTKRGVELIADAKQRGLPLMASTTWMHLLWNSEATASYDPNLRLHPPMGDVSDQSALITGVKEGIIDAIAIDHQAYTYEEKTVPFAQAPPGVIGLQLALPLLWQRFVSSGTWSALELWQALSSRPRQCLQQSPSAIALDLATDLVLFAPQAVWVANAQSLQSPAINTPWYNQLITGQVIKTWISR